MKNQDPNRRIQASRVRELCGGVSDMWIWRRLNDTSGFPKPTYIARNRFWRESDIIAWLDAQAEEAVSRGGREICTGDKPASEQPISCSSAT